MDQPLEIQRDDLLKALKAFRERLEQDYQRNHGKGLLHDVYPASDRRIQLEVLSACILSISTIREGN